MFGIISTTVGFHHVAGWDLRNSQVNLLFRRNRGNMVIKLNYSNMQTHVKTWVNKMFTFVFESRTYAQGNFPDA